MGMGLYIIIYIYISRITKNLQFKKGVGIDFLSLQQKVRKQVGS